MERYLNRLILVNQVKINVVSIFSSVRIIRDKSVCDWASKKFDIRIEFVPDAVNAPDVVRRFWRDLELMPEVADMIVDCSVGVVVKIFVPHKVYYHVIGEYPAGIHDEQGEDVKLFHCQHDLGLADIYQSVFQAEV